MEAILQPCYDNTHGSDRHHLVLKQAQADTEEEQTTSMVGMQQQGTWTQWESVLDNKISWTNIWQGDPNSSNSWSKLFMMSYLAQEISMSGAGVIL